MKRISPARLMHAIAALSASRAQVSSLLLLLAILMPIAAPLPAWAYDLNLPAPVVAEKPAPADRPSFIERLSGIADTVPSVVANVIPAFGDAVTDENEGEADTKNRREIGNKNRGMINSKEIFEDLTTTSPNAKSVSDEEDAAGTSVATLDELSNENPEVAPLLVEPTDQEVRDSTYTPENNIGTPPNAPEVDSPNPAVAARIKHRAGVANYSFDVPFASLPGRGMDASVGMTYNSRVWNKTGDGVTASYQFNVDKNRLAPGFTVGYGSFKTHFESKTVLMNNTQYKTLNHVVPEGYTDPNGTRHPFECKQSSVIPNADPNHHTRFYCSEYGTADGTFVKVIYNGSRPLSPYLQDDMSAYASTFFTLIHTDGSRVVYSAPGSQFGATDFQRDHYPKTIRDRNGNEIDIDYLDGTDNIASIRDTLGRLIKFYYDASAEKKLVAVTVPGFSGGERQTIRFYYEENVGLNHSGRFTGTSVGPATIRTLKYVYFPGTGTGYRYDYHTNFGMITKITKLTGMTVDGGDVFTATGTVNVGATEAASTEYLFPNDGSQTPLTDVPKFTQRTDDWLGRTSSSPITEYNPPEPATGADQVSKTTVKDSGFDVEYASASYNTTDWMNGLAKETTITRIQGPLQVRTQMSKTVYTWDQGVPDASGRRYPIIVKAEVINESNQSRSTTFEYDSYNNPKKVREHDYTSIGQLGAELRRTETIYQAGSSWVNNGLIRLPVEVKVIANGADTSKTVYEYDNYLPTGMEPAPNVTQHSDAYDPNSGVHACGFHYECGPGEFPPHCERVDDFCPNHDPTTDFRGNVTKIISFSNAAADTAAEDDNESVKTLAYDITGNVVKVSGVSCCSVKEIEYDDYYQYAYPTKVKKGSSTQLITEASYNLATGLVTQTKDENQLPTNYQYDPATLRQTHVDHANGAWSTLEFNDTTFPYSVKTTSSLDASRSISSWSYVNGAGQTFKSRSLTANGYLSNDVEFDQLGRAVKTYNPYTVAGLGDPRPAGTKATEITEFDALGRVLKTKLQDDTIVQSEYNGTVATMTDQAGKQRRQIADALGRIARVDEPDPSGDLGIITSPKQPTYYAYDGNDNLSKVTQTEGSVTQERVFEYDSLSRLLRERQVEATPTLDAAGVKGPSSPTKWTGVYKYTSDGLLDWGVDARGVKTDLTYDELNRVESVVYTGEPGYTTPTVTYTYGETESGFNNVGRLTKVQTSLVPNQTLATVQEYDYDSVGQIKKHVQTINGQTYSLEYDYNLAGQLTSEKYPSGKVVNMTVDNFGVVQTIADSQRTYVSGVTSAYTATGMTSQVTLGNGTTESFTLNERSQLTSQALKRGTEVLQKSDYGYGQIDGSGNLDTTKNNGQLAKIEAFIGAAKQRTQKFVYDSIGRLKQSEEYRGDTDALTYKQVFDFDRFGNLYRKLGSNPTTGQQNPLPTTWIEDPDISKSTNRFTTGTTYDDAGQVIQDNKFRSIGFSYDANGRVVKATKASTPDAHTVYDALGNRVATKINDVWQYMIYDAFGQLVAEYGVPSEGMGGVKYVQQDHQGTVRTITNSSGFVVSRTDHQAFGEALGAGIGLRSVNQGYGVDAMTRQSYGFTEKDDSSGQQHTWFRKLETQGGRWSSPDPYKGSMSLGDPQSLNRYSYVGNEPVNYVDPSGLLPNDNCPPGSVALPDGTCYFGVVGTRVPGSRDNAVQITQWAGWTLTNRGIGEPYIQQDDPLPFNSCAEFVDWLVRFAESKPFGIQDKHSRAKATGLALMDLAFNGYGRHINNGFAGFKAELVNPGEGTEEGPQGAGVYGHILGMGGAYLAGVMTGGRIAGWGNSAIDHLQNSVIGKAQGPAEVAGNKVGTKAGTHIWNLIRGNGTSTNLRESLTSDLCE